MRTWGEPMEMFGPYRLESLIGRGGMGEVHRAYDTKRERTVALKRLPAGTANEAEYRERFRRESRLAARLASPHVIPIHDFGEIDGRLYIDMRLVPGQDLAAVIATDGALPADRAVHAVRHVADALDSAHDAGMVHRDVKPSNILVSTYLGGDFSYLLDFGIVRRLDADSRSSLTSTGAAIGTLAYMAPEVFTGDGFDQRVDVYALACVLFEALSGRRPFDADGPGLMYRHLHAPPPSLTELRPDLPPALDEVVRHGMAKDPADRPATAGELARVVERSLTPGAASAPTLLPPVRSDTPTSPTTPAGPSTPPKVRRPRGLVVALVALLAAGAVAGTVVGVRAATTPADTTALRLTFPGIARMGPVCAVDEDPPEETSAGQTPLAVIRCADGPDVEWTFLEWPTPQDATLFTFDGGTRFPRVDDVVTWSKSKVRQGPWFKVSDGRTVTGYGTYDDRRFSFVVRGPDAATVVRELATTSSTVLEQVPR